MSGYFVSSFTWAEVTEMRATQPLTFRDQSYNGQYKCAHFIIRCWGSLLNLGFSAF